MTPEEEDPTRQLPDDPGEEPTEALPGREGDEPTDRIPDDRSRAATEVFPADGQGEPTRQIPEAGSGRRLGIAALIGSILAAVILCGAYIGFGGLDYRPAGGSDPCDPRPWGSPQGLEATAERFSLAAIDGASCELGLSREELIRALADENSRKEFAADHGLSDSQIEDAIRAGLLRATDDAERGGALSSLAATGARLAIKVMPMSVMIGLIENASTLFESGGGALSGLGGALDLFGGGTSRGGSGSGGSLDLTPGDLPGKVGGVLTDKLKEQLPPDVQEVLPDDLGSQVERGLNDLIKP